MKDDPTVEKIRQVRQKISEECGHDTEKLVKHYQEEQKKTKRTFFKKAVKEHKVA